MSRRSLILCLAALSVMLLGLGVAIAVLYSGTDNDDRRAVSYDGARVCLSAIPSDAVLVANFSHLDDACKGMLSGFEFPAAISEEIDGGALASFRRCPLTVSLHYSGKLCPLYVIQAKKATFEAVDALLALGVDKGFHSQRYSDFILVSQSETVLKSALRHLDRNASIADVQGFAQALQTVSGNDFMILPLGHAKRLFPAMFAGNVSATSSFVERLADWCVFETGSGRETLLSFAGSLLHDDDADEYLTVLDSCEPSATSVSQVLPSNTLYALALPLRDVAAYDSAYKTYMDSRQGLQKVVSKQNSLGKTAGVMPVEFFEQLSVREVATASFVAGGKVEKVNLIRVGNKDIPLIFKGTQVTSLKGYRPEVHPWAYPSFISSVYGKEFALADESCFTYCDGWIISGSRAALEEYTDKGALDYTLSQYLSDAGKPGLLSAKDALATGYFSFASAGDRLADYFGKEFLAYLSKYVDGYDLCPAIFSLTKDKKGISLSFDIHALTLQKTKAPSHDRDTVVVVPQGPFTVRNSHTGKMNMFYQNAQKAICLRDENGKDLWGVPFGKPICGTAHNIDYYANGKLQIIFASGSSIYIIDRLGRYVSGVPMDLGKEIVLGPDLYDFTGARRYNVLVLHKDNTVQMYNLKGKKPDAWKGIKADETIKVLPQRLTVGGKDFWTVRTSIQTLIFPFYGGDPVTVFEGDSKIRPDSPVTVVDEATVQVECYDGKLRRVKLR